MAQAMSLNGVTSTCLHNLRNDYHLASRCCAYFHNLWTNHHLASRRLVDVAHIFICQASQLEHPMTGWCRTCFYNLWSDRHIMMICWTLQLG